MFLGASIVRGNEAFCSSKSACCVKKSLSFFSFLFLVTINNAIAFKWRQSRFLVRFYKTFKGFPPILLANIWIFQFV